MQSQVRLFSVYKTKEKLVFYARLFKIIIQLQTELDMAKINLASHKQLLTNVYLLMC